MEHNYWQFLADVIIFFERKSFCQASNSIREESRVLEMFKFVFKSTFAKRGIYSPFRLCETILNSSVVVFFQSDFEAFLAVLDKSRFIRTKKIFGQDDPQKDEVSLLGQKIFEFASY